jgi:hypothetical protein
MMAGMIYTTGLHPKSQEWRFAARCKYCFQKPAKKYGMLAKHLIQYKVSYRVDNKVSVQDIRWSYVETAKGTDSARM